MKPSARKAPTLREVAPPLQGAETIDWQVLAPWAPALSEEDLLALPRGAVIFAESCPGSGPNGKAGMRLLALDFETAAGRSGLTKRDAFAEYDRDMKAWRRHSAYVWDGRIGKGSFPHYLPGPPESAPAVIVLPDSVDLNASPGMSPFDAERTHSRYAGPVLSREGG